MGYCFNQQAKLDMSQCFNITFVLYLIHASKFI